MDFSDSIDASERERPRFYSARLAVLLFLLLLIGLVLPVLNEAGVSECKNNLKSLGQAWEAYARDHGDRYPGSLSDLTPKYLRSAPTCPSVGSDTYSFAQEGALYTIYCSGLHHEKRDFPQFSSFKGVEQR